MARKESDLLGMNYATAQNRLRKLVLFSVLKRFDLNVCFRCEQLIEGVDTLSLEHTAEWKDTKDPLVAFFDLNNIAFSHLSCNSGAGHRATKGQEITHCPRGHEYSNENLGKSCLPCGRERNKIYRDGHKEQINEKKRDYMREYMRNRRIKPL